MSDFYVRLKRKQKISAGIRYFILIFVGFLMLYPLLWLFSSSFKSNNETILADMSLIPIEPTIKSYIEGWKTKTEFTYTTFYANTFYYIIVKSIVTVISTILVSYGFARFEFPSKRLWFSILIGTMFLPSAVTLVPQYIMFTNFRWIDTYLPMIVPTAFATQGFFVFLLVQFIRGIPKEMEESAQIDGASSLKTLGFIIVPTLKPAIASIVVFNFIWTMSDFMGPLIYINSPRKYPVSLALRMSIDISELTPWNTIFAMSSLALIPSIIVFLLAQRYFIDSMISSGIKG